MAAIGREIEHGRVRAFGVRNFTADRVHLAAGHTPIAAVITTELALPAAIRPLWPEYVPFDAALEQVVVELGLAVFAHADDFNLGQCLFDTDDPRAHGRWAHPANTLLVERVRRFAAANEITPREANIAWLFNRPFPVVAIASLAGLITDRATEFERASVSGPSYQ